MYAGIHARKRASPPRIPGHLAFFPAAAIYAIVVLPLSVAAMEGFVTFAPGLASPVGHAHEMLFGFALAVVAGNQLGPRIRTTLGVLMAVWIIARVGFVFAPQSYTAMAANVVFPALLAWHVAPRLVASAKKWRNQALPATLLAICASAVALTVAQARQRASRSLVDLGVAVFVLLLLFMGGRLIAPTVAGQIYRQGGNLEARVQPRIEAALMVVMAFAIVALALETLLGDAQPIRTMAGSALALAGAFAAGRLWRWRLWHLEKRPDLLCLGAGYAWLAVGLVLFGVAHAQLLGRVVDETIAIHVITIGSLGTLTLNVMAMTRLLTLRRAPASTRWPLYGTLLLAAALVLRIAAAYAGAPGALIAAALCWSAAYAMLLPVLFMRKGVNTRAGRDARPTL